MLDIEDNQSDRPDALSCDIRPVDRSGEGEGTSQEGQPLYMGVPCDVIRRMGYLPECSPLLI